MKTTFFFALITLFVTTTSALHAAQTKGLPVVTDFTVEAKDAKKRQVPILVLFMSESCPYCETVLQDFLLPMQRDHEYDNKVILRQIETRSQDRLIDFSGSPTTQNAFARKHKVWGVPVVMLFDSQGQVLTSITGLLTLDFYFAYLDNAINESQAKIKAGTKLR